MAKEINLNDIVLSQDAVQAWHEMSGRIAIALRHIAKIGREIPHIPYEQARINDDGTLTIFVNIPEVIDVSMGVPAEHWSYRQ